MAALLGINCRVRIESLGDPTAYLETHRNFSSLKKVFEFSDGEPIKSVTALLFPVRTNSLKNFASDLIFPTLIPTLSERVHTFFLLRIFDLLMVTFMDVVFLPVRLITAIPRSIYNHFKQEAPLHTFIKTELRNLGVLSANTHKLLDSGVLHIRIHTDMMMPSGRVATGYPINDTAVRVM